MKVAYAFSGRSPDGINTEGRLVGASSESVERTLRGLGIVPTRVRVDLAGTVRVLTAQTFDPIDLSLAYRTIAKQLEIGNNPSVAFSLAVDCVEDVALQAALLATASLLNRGGETLSRAMSSGGFPQSDVSVVALAEVVGKVSAVLVQLALECERNGRVAAAIKSEMLMPKIVGVAACVLIFMVIWKLGPQQEEFFRTVTMGEHLHTPTLDLYFRFIAWTKANTTLFMGLYAAVCAGIVAIAMSPPARKVFWLYGPLARLMEESDLALQWSMYRAFFEAGGVASAPRFLAKNSRHPKVKRSFERFVTISVATNSLTQAVRTCGFSRVVSQFIAMGERSGDLSGSLKALCDQLHMQIENRLRYASVLIKGISMMFAGIVVLAVFAAVYGPYGLIMQSLLSGRGS